MLVVALVPLVALGSAVLGIQRDGLGRVEKELELAVVDEAAGKVADALDASATLARATSRLIADTTVGADERLARVRMEAERTPAVASVAFFDPNGEFIDAVLIGNDERSDVARVPPTGGGLRVLRPDGAPPIVRFEAPLPDTIPGSVIVTLARDGLEKELEDLSAARFGAADRLFLVDDTMRVVAGGATRRTARSPIFGAAGWPPSAFASPVLLTTEFDDAGTAKVGTVRTLPSAALAVVVERPISEAFAAYARARKIFLATLVAVALSAAALGWLLARRTLAPVALLGALIERYGKREFHVRSEVRTRDELEALGASLERMADELSSSEAEIARRAKIEADLGRFLPSEVAEAVARGDTSRGPSLGGERRELTVLFADVVAFTSFAEQTTPERAVAFLNELFTILSEVVFRHGGTVDKFIGDCIMAVFVAHAPAGAADDHAERALRAADDMHRFVASTGHRWRSEFGFDVKLGIGVATGDALVGNLGSEKRMEYTAIGDVVNVAARLEMLAAPRQTLTTVDVAGQCAEFDFASLGARTLRGRAQPIEVFEVLG